MTPTELRQALDELEMDQSQAAGYLRVTQSAVSRWLTGARPIPGPITRLVEDALAALEDKR
jgi:predicted transcriptional regulator